jgi:hemolysin activation/secretion protein
MTSLSFFSCQRLLIFLVLVISPICGQVPQSQVEDPVSQKDRNQNVQRDGDHLASSEEILIPKLQGLSISSVAEDALSLQAQAQQGIRTAGLSANQQQRLHNALQPWLGKAVSLTSLNLIARSAERAIAPQKDSWITASYPPQEITSGYVAMVIAVPTMNSLSFTGKPRFGTDFITGAVLSKADGSASAESVRKDIDFLNRNPFRRATALWSPAVGELPAANLIIQIKEKRPWSIFTGLDNYASDDLGDERFYLGGKFGNVFDLDHRLGWMLLSTADGSSLHATNLSYDIPLPRHRLLHFSTSFSESSTTSPSTLIDNNGKFFSFRSHIETPLPDWHGLRHRWQGGFSLRENEYRQGTNELDVSIFQLEQLWLAEAHDRHGFTELTAGLLWNPGGGFLSSNDASYAALGATDSDSWVATIHAERDVPLQNFGNLEVKADAQWTNENLIPSNQFAGGGVQRLRGYDEGSVFFDRALMLSAEWQFQRFSLPGKSSAHPHLFIDHAELADHDGQSTSLSSVGAGVQWSGLSHYAARLEFAQPLQRLGNQPRDPVLYFSLNTFW